MGRALRLATLGVPVGGGGAAFSPLDVENLQVWLKADAITGLNDGDAVASWLDASGNGRNATQGTADNRPTYKVNIVNGMPVVRFDGTNDFLLCTKPTGADAHYFLVVKKRTAPGTTEKVCFMASSVSFILADSDVSMGYHYWANETFGSTAYGVAATDWNLLELDYASELSLVLARNGTVAATIDPRAGQATSTQLSVGARNDGGSPIDIDVPEFLLYVPGPSAADAAKIRAYLAGKYSLGF